MKRITISRFLFFTTLLTFPLCFPTWLSNLMPFNSYSVSLSILPLMILDFVTFFEFLHYPKYLNQTFVTIFSLFVILGLYSSFLGFVFSRK